MFVSCSLSLEGSQGASTMITNVFWGHMWVLMGVLDSLGYFICQWRVTLVQLRQQYPEDHSIMELKMVQVVFRRRGGVLSSFSRRRSR